MEVKQGRSLQQFEILLANPRGFCAGVDRAITIVEKALELFGPPIYVRHEVVHNRYVVADLAARGVVFTDEINEIPIGSIAIFSAHGVSQQVRAQAAVRKLRVFDATCPLVTKVHLEVMRYSRLGYECILIGHAGHPEVEGTLGQYDCDTGGIYLIQSLQEVSELSPKNVEQLVCVTQTTLSVDETRQIIAALREKFPKMITPKKDDICYATQNRQDAVKQLSKYAEVVIVVGSPTSSNSNRLSELANELGSAAYLIDQVDQLSQDWVKNKKIIGVTAGASAPEVLVQAVVKRLTEWGGVAKELPGIEESISFSIPKELR